VGVGTQERPKVPSPITMGDRAGSGGDSGALSGRGALESSAAGELSLRMGSAPPERRCIMKYLDGRTARGSRPEHASFPTRAWSLDDLPLVREASSDPYIPKITTVPADYTDHAGHAFLQGQAGSSNYW